MFYPVAEIFHSIQGEGVFTGTPMLFVRLAGCNVGVASSQGSVCRTFTGAEFPCDTDYKMTKRASEQEIIQECHEEHICITGGEPFIHDLSDLIHAFVTPVPNKPEWQGLVHIE